MSQFLEMSRNLDLYSPDYENLIVTEVLNTESHQSGMKDFCKPYKVCNLITEPTCYKNPENLSGIELLLINCPPSFQNLCIIETPLYDFHKMIVTVMKLTFEKLKRNVTPYTNFKSFSNDTFREYQWKTLIHVAIIWKNFLTFGSVLLTTLLIRRKSIHKETMPLL